MVFSADERRTNRLPDWLRRKIPLLGECTKIEISVKRRALHTICREGLCPNRAECYSRGKVTFMMLGDICTRNCSFCSVEKGIPRAPDPGEPARIAEAASELGLKHVIVTSVTRDDLPDGGASMYRALICELRKLDPAPVIEVLVPDFRGDRRALETVMEAGPDIFSHNIETVERIYPYVRKGADYSRSMRLLREAKDIDKGVKTKSSLMLGLGETLDEVLGALRDLRRVQCDFTAMGQYLRPGNRQVPVREYVRPGDFSWLEEKAYEMGFEEVSAGPLVRSSYQENSLERHRQRERNPGEAVVARRNVQ